MKRLLVLVLGVAVLAWGQVPVIAGPPVATMDPTSPGLNVLFSGDPDTTEAGCRDQGRAGPEEFHQIVNCSWDFAPHDYGKFGNLQQGDWRIDASTTSTDGHSECGPRDGFTSDRCTTPVMRYEVTTKQQPDVKAGMNPDRDWVFSTDFSRNLDSTSSMGAADVFQLHTAMELPGSRDFIDLVELPETPGIMQLKALNADNMTNRTVAEFGQDVIDLFEQPRKISIHYKSDTRLFDFWIDETLMLEDFFAGDGVSEGGMADLVWIQLGSSSPSAVVTQSFDNVLIGVVANTDACGSGGPGANVPGDFNCDGLVDVADLGIIGANFNGAEVTYVDGDANLDGGVDVADLGVVGANWSAAQLQSVAQSLNGAGLNAQVPEPATLSLIAMATLLLAGRRR